MAISLSIKADIKKAQRYLSNVQKKQLPFAASKAMKDTIEDCQKALISQAQKVFENKKTWYKPQQPTGIKRRYSKKSEWPRLVAVVWTNAPFARLQEDGGIKKPTRSRNLLIPTSNTAKSNRNAKGPEKVLRQKNVFSNKRGIWKKTGGKKNPVVKRHFVRAKSAVIKPRFEFVRTADRVARLTFKRNFERAMERALRTAK